MEKVSMESLLTHTDDYQTQLLFTNRMLLHCCLSRFLFLPDSIQKQILAIYLQASPLSKKLTDNCVVTVIS